MMQAQTVGHRDTSQAVVPAGDFYEIDKTSPKWIRELKNVILVSPKNDSENDTFNIQSPSDIYIGTEGRTITNIRIIRTKPFGTTVYDTIPGNVSWLGGVGNTVHVNTQEFIIRNVLLFHEGDTVNSFQLADSERFLRELRYVDDARIVAVPLPDDRAEVLVVVQDIFPYAVDFGTNFSSKVNLALTNRNIVGLGVEMRAGTFIDSREDNLMGYEARLRINNIGRSFISFEADYLDQYDNKRWGFLLKREFYAATTKYAGHLNVYQSQIPVDYYDPQVSYTEINPITVKFNYMNAWLGRSFLLNQSPFNKQRNNLAISLGLQRTYFLEKPENAQHLYYQFQDRTIFLTSLTYSQQAYYKTNLIYNFGRTEDIPYGYSLSAIVGKEYNEMYNRPYVGANFSSGYFIPKLGYLSGIISFGTFLSKGIEQGTLDFEMNYFTNLYVIGRFRQRTFINGQYTRQLDTKLRDYLAIEGEYGIPGFKNDSIHGRHRFNFSLEQDLFTPWQIYGFRFVLYAFANFSWIGGYDKPIMNNALYSSFGVGFRVRNNRLIFNTLQVRFAYFPNIPANSRFRYIEFSKETILKPRDFMPKAPEVILLY